MLLSLSTEVVTFVAEYFMGHRSKTYMEFLEEDVDYRAECARYAATAMVGACVFA